MSLDISLLIHSGGILTAGYITYDRGTLLTLQAVCQCAVDGAKASLMRGDH